MLHLGRLTQELKFALGAPTPKLLTEKPQASMFDELLSPQHAFKVYFGVPIGCANILCQPWLLRSPLTASRWAEQRGYKARGPCKKSTTLQVIDSLTNHRRPFLRRPLAMFLCVRLLTLARNQTAVLNAFHLSVGSCCLMPSCPFTKTVWVPSHSSSGF